MYIILGATGHIGAVLTQLLVQEGQQVTGITSNNKNVARIEKMGAAAAVADVCNTDQLAAVFKKGKRLYLLNPPAPPDTDTSAKEQEQVDSIIAAIRQANFEKIVAESTYGAQPGNQLGDLDVLYKMELAVKAIHPHTDIIRGAYYMSNWDFSRESAEKEGKIYSLYPPDFALPMVAPKDIAAIAAKKLQSPPAGHTLTNIEGPKTYAPADVAAAFAKALHKHVEVVEIKRPEWISYLQQAGFSEPAAQSMANMTALTLDNHEQPAAPERGATSLEKYILELVQKRSYLGAS
jgi:uncharacterized protein YbjT (DUF2867 family)